MVVEADGGSRGNPGPAGYGAVVRDALTGEVLAERSGGLGVTTNNVAEYEGLLAGLRAAVELGADEVEVRMDSKLVVEQMCGRWKVRQEHLQPLVSEGTRLVGSLSAVRFTWVPRSRNAHADRLANEAMDAQAGVGDRLATPEPAASADAPVEPVVARAAVTAPPGAWSGALGEPTRFLLLRHGQTEVSAQRRYSGRGDIPLTALGEQQAAAAAKRLAAFGDVAAVVSSPLLRTRQTAQAVAEALGVEPVTHDGLVETDFGAWEGLTFAEAAERDPELHRRWLSDPGVPTPGGESFDQVHRRVRRARDELIAAHGAATVVVVSHVTPIKSVLRMALDVGPSLLYRLHLDLASLSVAEFYPDGNASVRLVNDTSHLR
ncbi:bifunctional RNase H/acid phosphatase [Streptoalloteichus tenebrarius]|uniref:bifunctional RNase H/acid phosphatase n=1 Tax=Streptoalloteichus tenebrarius (strain ATCC 17920 / DSM 40477 / JCM 4838 / CBS 697.72 / NBRC 16177 / NCIMB 11028 / NRRL B-12390 / A12253. 1 / ISP 5477) TaxID=1933 RepID=UPI0020A5A7D0|nr:bifunctional RNase H/acid phosphatase [Streptoalloteichus tenebrarius]